MTIDNPASPGMPSQARLKLPAGALELVIRPDPAGGFEIRLRIDDSADAGVALLPDRFEPELEPGTMTEPGTTIEPGTMTDVEVLTSAGSPSTVAAAGAVGAVEVRAPLVGVFYRRPSPAEPPFVEIGSQVEAGSTLAIVEAMKMMNHIPAPVSGRVVAIGVEDNDVVEFDEVLVAIHPEGSPA
jgi:acetyl-CoA carboxylase biotin carboxyl carrier protein